MNKVLSGLLVLAAVSTASAANYVGGSVGSGFSIHYQTDRTYNTALRYGINLDATQFKFDQLTLGGSVDYLINFPNNRTSLGLQAANVGIQPYYGFGLSAGVALNNDNNGTGFAVYPHALLGAKYQVSAPLSIFGEINAGPSIQLATNNSHTDFGFGARLGINYTLNR